MSTTALLPVPTPTAPIPFLPGKQPAYLPPLVQVAQPAEAPLLDTAPFAGVLNAVVSALVGTPEPPASSVAVLGATSSPQSTAGAARIASTSAPVVGTVPTEPGEVPAAAAPLSTRAPRDGADRASDQDILPPTAPPPPSSATSGPIANTPIDDATSVPVTDPTSAATARPATATSVAATSIAATSTSVTA
ncbi:MAG TPA: hypothetical protein VFX76_02690, partial [Roseiflexaceae bacterium]|nr:hypothetical protein [Roseiflexaceae bacterium]